MVAGKKNRCFLHVKTCSTQEHNDMSNNSIYEPHWKAALPGPGHYDINENLIKIGTPNVNILSPPYDPPDSRTHYPAGNAYDVQRWPKQPFDQSPHAGDCERQTDESAHAMPGGIYEPSHITELPGPGHYDPVDAIEKPRTDSLGRMTPHDTWRTQPIPAWKQEVNNVPMRVLPSTLATQPSVKITGKPVYASDSRLHYPAPHDTAPLRWPRDLPAGFQDVDAVENNMPRERAHSVQNGSIYDPQWKVELPGPGQFGVPSNRLTKPSTNIGGTMIPHDTWRTEPLPLWKQEVNNVPHVVLPSTLNKQPAVQIRAKPYDPPSSTSSFPASNEYNVPRWPTQPFDQDPHDAVALADRFRQEAAQARLEDILRPEFPDEYENKLIHVNPAGANYQHLDSPLYDNPLYQRLGTLGGQMTPHDTWRTEPIPQWKKELNNIPHVLLPGSLKTQPAVKICAMPHIPDQDNLWNPGPDHYDVRRFPESHFEDKETSGSRPGKKHTTSTGAIRNRPRSRPFHRYPDASLKPVTLPAGYKRGYNDQLRSWYWYDPSGNLPLRLAPEDGSRWLAQRGKEEVLRQAAAHGEKKGSSRSPKPSHLYAEDGGKAVRGVVRAEKPWGPRKGVPSKGSLNSDWSSPFLNLNTFKKTKSGMRVPRQSTSTLPLSSLQMQKQDILSWVKKSRGPNVTAKGPPVMHGMYVKSVRPKRVSSVEIARMLEKNISGMNQRLERSGGVHPSWEEKPAKMTFHGLRSEKREEKEEEEEEEEKEEETSLVLSKESGPVAKRKKNLVHRVEEKVEEKVKNAASDSPKEKIKNMTMLMTTGAKEAAEEASAVVTPGDSVFYRMHSGVIKVAVVVALPTLEDGWTLRLRVDGPLCRQVRDNDVFKGPVAPQCKCGKHGAHKGKCFGSHKL